MLNRWFYINAAVLLFALWKVFTGYVALHVLLGLIGLLFFLYNWTRHAIFSTIRANIPRARKIKYAKLSKKKLPFHKYTGTLALIVIGTHATAVLHIYPFMLTHWKITSGIGALIALFLLVVFGWIRFFKTTYPVRIIHWTLAFVTFFLICIHLFL